MPLDAAAISGSIISDEKVSECTALPAQPREENGPLLIDCAGTIGALQLASGELKPLVQYQGALGYVTMAGDYAVYVAENAVYSVSLNDGALHELARTFSPTVLAVTRDGRYVVVRGARGSNTLLAAAVNGSEPAREITDAYTQQHRLQGTQDRLLYTHGDAVASVDLTTGKAADLGPTMESIFSSDGSLMAFIDEAHANVIVTGGDGSERRELEAPDPKPTSLVTFTRNNTELVVRHDGGMRRLTLDSGAWSDLAAPPAGALMQLDVTEHALIYQHALGEIDPRSGVFRDGFGLSAVPLNGEPSVMLSKLGSSYFRDYIWHSPGSFSSDFAELIYPTMRRGLDVVDLEALTVRPVADVGCSEGGSGFSPDRQTLYYWVCDDSNLAKQLNLQDRQGNLLLHIDEETMPPLKFARDSKHFTVQGREGFWLAAVSGESQFFAMDEQHVNTQGRETPAYFPLWRDSAHVVYNHDGVHVISLR